MRPVGVERGGQGIDALVLVGFGHEHRDLPLGRRPQLQHRLQLGLHAQRSLAIGFVHHEDVRDLEQSGFHHLHRVSGLRHQHDDDRARELHDVELGLADPDGFDQDSILAEGV